MYQHGTIIPTEITCLRKSRYMENLASRQLIVKNAKIFSSYVNIFEFSHSKEIVQS